MTDITKLLSEIHSLSGEKLEESMMELADFVKMHEGDEQLSTVENAMPSLCEYLLYDGPYIVAPCMLSIFRRVPIKKDTISALISLYRIKKSDVLIWAFSNVDGDEWTSEVEEFLVQAAEFYPLSIAEVYFGKSCGVIKPNILNLLMDIFLKRDALVDKHNVDFYISRLILTICNQTGNGNYSITIPFLEQILPGLEKRLVTELIESLSFGQNRGMSIYKLTSKNEDPDIRLVTIQSLERVKSRDPGASDLLEQLAKDENNKVAAASKKALSN